MNEQVAKLTGDGLTAQTEWLERRIHLLDHANDVQVVENEGDLNSAGKTVTDMSKHLKVLDKARKEITGPIDAMKKEIMAQQKEMAAPLDEEIRRLKALSSDYATRVAREAAAEQRRKEAAYRAEQEAAAALAQRQQEMFPGVVPASSAPAFVPPPPPPIALPKAKGATMVAVVKFEIMDQSAVPRQYLAVNESAIRSHIAYCKSAGIVPSIPGVRVYEEMQMHSRG